MIVVTKYVSDDAVEAVLGGGCHELGESRPQDLWHRAQKYPGAKWHLIGHLQRNKVRRTLPHTTLLHSVDSFRLLASIQDEAKSIDRRFPALLQVNISGEDAKQGWAATDMPAVVDRLMEFPNVEVQGLMGMASFDDSQDVVRRQFAKLRECAAALRLQMADPKALPELSMGMSHDYEIAVEEGATLVRIGSAIFEGIDQGLVQP
jgi:hypothetical protein